MSHDDPDPSIRDAGGSVTPPSHVLAAFGVADRRLARLPGGQSQTWLAGDLVLKPMDSDLATMTWIETLTKSLDGRSDFRVAPPVRSSDDHLVVDGWTGWRFEPGEPASKLYRRLEHAWDEVLEVGDLLNQSLAGEPRPAFLDNRTDRCAEADRLVGRGMPTGLNGQLLDYLATASRYMRPFRAESQLIHGDLTGNVMFADDQPPLVIDFSPYWRPPTFALAVVVVDVMAHHTGGAALASRQRHRRDFAQYLIQAALFRLLSERPDFPLRDSPYIETLQSVCRLIESRALEP